jgi:NDP-sugar pyrophosphorylase family protein
VAEVGFVDLKEQAIHGARGHGPLHAVHREPGASLPIRTLEEYIDALRAIHAVAPAGGTRSADPFAETWEPAFAIVEPGAQVGDGAFLQDSVVLSGAVVGRGAILARSLVCSGAVVPAGACVVDRIVTGRP